MSFKKLRTELLEFNDEETVDSYIQTLTSIKHSVEFNLHEISSSMEEYTQGAEGSFDLNGTINSDFGKYKYKIYVERCE